MITKLIGLCFLIGSLAVVYLFESSSHFTGALRIFHWPAMVLTLVGPCALVMTCSDWKALVAAMGTLVGPSVGSRHKRREREAMLLQKLSRDFYTDGPEVFEGIKHKSISPFLLKTFERLATRMPGPDIRDLLEAERDRKQIRSVQALQVVSMGVRLTPSVGMLGTILGMVQLLSSLQDPAQIGSHMSLALLTTFYGLFFSLAVWTPLQQKIEQVLDCELEAYNQTVRWLELLEKRKSANYFAEAVNIPVKQGGGGGKEAA